MDVNCSAACWSDWPRERCDTRSFSASSYKPAAGRIAFSLSIDTDVLETKARNLIILEIITDTLVNLIFCISYFLRDGNSFSFRASIQAWRLADSNQRRMEIRICYSVQILCSRPRRRRRPRNVNSTLLTSLATLRSSADAASAVKKN